MKSKSTPIMSTIVGLLFALTLLFASAQTTTAQWTSSNGNTTTSDKVGIGTTSPQRQVHIHDTAPMIQLTTTSSGATASDGFLILNYGGGTVYFWNYENQPTIFANNNSETMRITASGDVGIGTTSPTTKLHVAGDGKFTGNLTVDGNIATKFQDVAEWVESSERLPAGTVVILDSTKSNQVVSSIKAYDTRVAGVISEQPGIALGQKSESKVLVATTGRVKVKVDATKSSIQIGDLLVTSDVPGVAMKSAPVKLGGVQLHRPGTLIGKALQPLAKGKGEILVLLSLQ